MPAPSLNYMVIEKLGRYVIVEEIGQGAMGVVYKAVDPLIDRTVAIKTINLDLSKEELANFEKRFQREVQSAGKLNHPNIVTVYDVGRTEGVAYMAMEFLEGKELREILDSGVVLPIEKIAHIASQVAEGLAFAHEHGIVHRDVKPANVMVMKNGLIKITDFGIAQMSSASRTVAGMVMGSPKYMSPEQVVGQAVDGRSDIFALGVVIYEMLTGKTPFAGDNISAIMYQILNDDPAPPKNLNQNIPDSINYIVLKALAKHPDKRYQNAKELARDIKRYKTMEVPSGEEAPKVPESLERRKRPREQLGDATQVLPSLVSGAAVTRSAPALRKEWWSTPRILLYAAIPAMIIVFALVVTFTKRSSSPTEPPVSVAQVPQGEIPASPPSGHIVSPTPSAADAAAKPETPVIPPSAGLGAAPPPIPAPLPSVTLDKPSNKSEATKSTVDKLAQDKTLKTDGANKFESASKATISGEEATATLAISPWGEVFVDGKRLGVTPPLRSFKVAPGKHTILIVNETFKPFSQTLDFAPGGSHKIKYKFQN